MDLRFAPLSTAARHLLLVDDEESILRSLQRMLRRDGYVIHLATSGEDGLAILEREPVGVIVTDQRMPVMTGSQFLSKVKDRYPDTIRIVLSGYTELNSITDAINTGAIYKFLTKPWDDQLLREQIAGAFAHHELKSENARVSALNRAIIDAIPDALLLVDVQRRLISAANAAAGALLGHEAATLSGRAISEIEPLPLDHCYWDEMASGDFRALHAVETEYLHADGSLLPVRKSTAKAADGAWPYVLVLAHDLRHERTIESSLQRLNAEMASVLEASSEGLLVLDAERRLSRINRRLHDMWSLPDELLSSSAGESILRWIAGQAATPPQASAALFAHFAAAAGRSSGHFELRNGDNCQWHAHRQERHHQLSGHVFCFALPGPLTAATGSADQA
ncbi:MAG: response regulator [Candidatus Accumulibacter sp.]|uniref:response regulator n=1 Tax=Accumulibacter sp. TaxID=2053492 RepID=UPI001A04A0B5|nr:response regulator [Accumulibacter sp.]MBE2257804.1 response regulator [Paracoccaceae bacterium]MCP5250018.1 response regulator [Accumulibacter sp.]